MSEHALVSVEGVDPWLLTDRGVAEVRRWLDGHTFASLGDRHRAFALEYGGTVKAAKDYLFRVDMSATR